MNAWILIAAIGLLNKPPTDTHMIWGYFLSKPHCEQMLRQMKPVRPMPRCEEYPGLNLRGLELR